MAKIAITGISGRAGGHVGRYLAAHGHEIVGISRRAIAPIDGIAVRQVPDMGMSDDWAAALAGCDVLFHFADRANRHDYAEAHVGEAAEAMRAIRNAAVSLELTRIVVASSVHAERPDRPADRYGRSKRAMEVIARADVPGSPAIILRLPPLCGPNAGGMLAYVDRAVRRGLPLPFGRATAGRRFLPLDALASLCARLTDLQPSAFALMTGKLWMPADPRIASLRALSRSLGRAKLIPVPGIDRMIGGGLPLERIIEEQDRLARASGWRA